MNDMKRLLTVVIFLKIILKAYCSTLEKMKSSSDIQYWTEIWQRSETSKGVYSHKKGDINHPKYLWGVFSFLGFYSFFLKISNVVLGFQNFGYGFWGVGGDVWRWLCRHVRLNFSAGVDRGLSGGSDPGARTPISDSGNYNLI